MRERDRCRGGHSRRGSRSQVDSRHAVAMSHIRDARFTSGGEAHRLDGVNLHDGFHGRPAGTQRQQLTARGVEDENGPVRSDGKIDKRDRFQAGSNGEGLQGAAGNQLQLVQRCCTVVRRRRADHPEISTSVVNLDRCDVAKSRGGGADEVHRMIRAVGDDHQFAPEPIANKESARDRIVGEPAKRKALGREPGAIRAQRRGRRGREGRRGGLATAGPVERLRLGST